MEHGRRNTTIITKGKKKNKKTTVTNLILKQDVIIIVNPRLDRTRSAINPKVRQSLALVMSTKTKWFMVQI
jgi:hypothetical protein